MSSSDKIVYAPRAESGHANSRKVRSPWPQVIATESYLARCQPAAYGLGFSPPRSTARDHLRPRAMNLTLAAHCLAFVSLRVIYYSYHFNEFFLSERRFYDPLTANVTYLLHWRINYLLKLKTT